MSSKLHTITATRAAAKFNNGNNKITIKVRAEDFHQAYKTKPNFTLGSFSRNVSEEFLRICSSARIESVTTTVHDGDIQLIFKTTR